MSDILALLDREKRGLENSVHITFLVTMKKHGEISTYFRLKHHCEKEV